MISYDKTDNISALEAQFEAQRIAFSPVVFQAAIAMLRLGILELVHKNGSRGISGKQISKELNIPLYGVKVLLESGLSSKIVYLADDKFILTKTGYFLLHDELTQVNMNFINDVCYKGLFNLREAIMEEKAAGLKEFGDWNTIYSALGSLPSEVQKSWFEFDHFYSDIAFSQVLPIVFQKKREKLLDIGGNTGKWALECVKFSDNVEVTVVDLPGQIKALRENINELALNDRIKSHPVNILDSDCILPKGADVIWMSQFLDCFSEDQIIDILIKVRDIMDKDAVLYILELFWDRQKRPGAAFSLLNISLYFTCMANGNSKFYHSEDLTACIEKAGLALLEQKDGIGVAHTLLTCKKT